MKITKYGHSCLLVEENNTNILFDPGIFTYNEKTLNIASLANLNYILITHSHADHMHIPFVKELVQKFPNVQIISNAEVVGILAKEGITATINGNEFINATPVQHEKLFGMEAPQNTLFTIFNSFAHPGDCLSFKAQCSILALPITAPWGSTTQAVELAEKLKPQTIIPIHDWQLKDQSRIGMYDRLEQYFKDIGIDFKKPQDGLGLEI